ncbi:hypothetical protein BKA80DRAFT_257294 [Phyllosticta citrichinensis]
MALLKIGYDALIKRIWEDEIHDRRIAGYSAWSALASRCAEELYHWFVAVITRTSPLLSAREDLRGATSPKPADEAHQTTNTAGPTELSPARKTSLVAGFFLTTEAANRALQTMRSSRTSHKGAIRTSIIFCHSVWASALLLPRPNRIALAVTIFEFPSQDQLSTLRLTYS